jgi:hypothetical protein
VQILKIFLPARLAFSRFDHMSVCRLNKEGIAKNENDWSALDSCLAQLRLLKDLGFRPDTVDAGIATFERALERLKKPEDRWQPRLVLLFSGHMVDASGRAEPRFPLDKEPIAVQKIGRSAGSAWCGAGRPGAGSGGRRR